MRSALTVVAIVIAATAIFWMVLHPISSAMLDVALRPEVRASLEKSMGDQKRLRSLDPERQALYRARFDETQKLINRIDVIRLNRDAMLRRFEIALTVVFLVSLIVGGIIAWRRARRAEEAKRREYVGRFAAWQGAARRHAHEIKTPLTAARLEVERLSSLTEAGASPQELRVATESVFEELDRLARFTREFSSFAAVAQPVTRTEELNGLVEQFCTTFANAWPNIALQWQRSADVTVAADRDLLRQVLANLCANSARAVNGSGRVVFSIDHDRRNAFLDVADNGTGIPDSVRPRVFDPYITTRNIGEGMGLGLSIARKIMLDHGGDLVLLESSAGGTIFRLTLPRV
jgi:two-component system nitrogen regulation sensor histidine kinase NtrY